MGRNTGKRVQPGTEKPQAGFSMYTRREGAKNMKPGYSQKQDQEQCTQNEK